MGYPSALLPPVLLVTLHCIKLMVQLNHAQHCPSPVSMGSAVAPTSSSSVPGTSSSEGSSTPIQDLLLNCSRCSVLYSGSGPALGTPGRPFWSGFYKRITVSTTAGAANDRGSRTQMSQQGVHELLCFTVVLLVVPWRCSEHSVLMVMPATG